MKTKSFLTCATAAIICNVTIHAAIPPGYYDRANGLKCKELKTAMHMICGYADALAYGSGEGKTWTGFYRTDRMENGQVRDRYSNEAFHFSNMDSEYAAYAVTGMNIEHSFPKSWWNGTENQAYKDLFNLMPSQSSINGSKSNYPMGMVKTANTDNGCTKVGRSENGITLWEPADRWKGDFARSYFYMVTMYSHLPWEGTQATQILQDDEWPTLRQWAYELYMEWARKDPVDDIERERNEAVYDIQGNRNPYVDFPSLAEYVWGDSTGYAFRVPGAGTENNPEEYSGTVAFPATDVVSNTYSCSFNANWCKARSNTSYTLDVYTKNNNCKHSSLNGYPKTVGTTTDKVTDILPGTTYYYKVTTPDGNTSNETEVRVPYPSAVFTVSPMMAKFSAMPGCGGQPTKFTVSLADTRENTVTAYVDQPFELAAEADAAEWSRTLELQGASTTFYVRLAPQNVEGEYSGTLRVCTAGEQDKYIPLAATVDKNKSFFEDFETGNKGAYAAGTVRCSAAEWLMDNAVIGKDANANDTYSVRIKGTGSITMTEDRTGGCDSLWFYTALYNKDTGVSVNVCYSTDEGASWTYVTEAMPVTTWQRYGFSINTRENVRLKIEAIGKESKRINIDDIQMSGFNEDTGIRTSRGSSKKKKGVYDLHGRKRTSMPTPAQGKGTKDILIIDGRKIAF